MRAIIALGLLTLSAGCGGRSPADEQPPRRPSATACDSARALLERKVEESRGAFLFEEHGEAMIDTSRWMGMGADSQDDLVRSLATLAGCNAATPQREVQVVIRGEAGAVLERRFLSPHPEASSQVR